MDYKTRVKYDDKEWLVIDAFKYEGKSYMYLVEDIKEEINSAQELQKYPDGVRVQFIEKTEGENYITVTEKEKLDILNYIVAKRFLEKNK